VNLLHQPRTTRNTRKKEFNALQREGEACDCFWTATEGGTLWRKANRMSDNAHADRGRDGALSCAAPPSEPDVRLSRIRLSSRGFADSAFTGVHRTEAHRKSKQLRLVPWRLRSPLCRWILWRPRGSSAAHVLAQWAIDLRCRARPPFPFRLHFLPPLAPPALPGFDATMATLTPAESPLPEVCPDRSPVVTSLPFPDILPPTTLTAPRPASASRGARSWLRPSPAGSPLCLRLFVFTFVAVYPVLSVALHPASWRRSYFKFPVRNGH